MSAAPKNLPVFLPPSHPFVKLSPQEFENIFGAHAYLIVVRPIPLAKEKSS